MLFSSNSNAVPARSEGAAWLGGSLIAMLAAGLNFFPELLPSVLPWWEALGFTPARSFPAVAVFFGNSIVGLAGVWVATKFTAPLQAGFMMGTAGFLTFSQSAIFALYGRAWEPLPALLALFAGGGIAWLVKPAPSALERLFQGRLSATSLTILEKARDLSFLRPDQREASVLTCRLLNENALREALTARDFLKLCDTFRTRASALLMQHGACLDPAEPNGVRAFFGLPLPAATPAGEAVRAALALDEAMQTCFAGLSPVPPELPICGIGLATGTLTAGTTGTGYTVLGDAVELSRWLGSLNGTYQTRILMDAATHLAADNVEDRPLEFINPPEGAAVEIFQLLGTTGSLSCEALARRNAFRDAIMLLRAGHATDAAGRFEDARGGLAPPDPVLDYFLGIAQDQSQRDAASTGPPVASAPGPPPSPPVPNLTAARRNGRTGRTLPRRP